MANFEDLQHTVRDGRQGWRSDYDGDHHATAVLTPRGLVVRVKRAGTVVAIGRYTAAALGLENLAALRAADVQLAMHELAHEHFAHAPSDEDFGQSSSDRDAADTAGDAPEPGLYNLMARTPWTRDLKLRPAG